MPLEEYIEGELSIMGVGCFQIFGSGRQRPVQRFNRMVHVRTFYIKIEGIFDFYVNHYRLCFEREVDKTGITTMLTLDMFDFRC